LDYDPQYGFSDATEIFVFISAFTAAFLYGRAMMPHITANFEFGTLAHDHILSL
jgi:hypothetical protein